MSPGDVFGFRSFFYVRGDRALEFPNVSFGWAKNIFKKSVLLFPLSKGEKKLKSVSRAPAKF